MTRLGNWQASVIGLSALRYERDHQLTIKLQSCIHYMYTHHHGCVQKFSDQDVPGSLQV